MAITITESADTTSAEVAKQIADQLREANPDIEIPDGEWIGWGHEVDVKYDTNSFIIKTAIPDFKHPTFMLGEAPGGIRWSAKIRLSDNHIMEEPRTERIPFHWDN